MAGETRQKVYQYLVKYITKHGYAPTVRDICVGVGLKSTSSVYCQLRKLEEEGKIEMRGNSSRAIKLVDFEFVWKK